MNSITPFGKRWEWSRSIWLVWLLFPFGFLSFISFIYIGLRTRKMKWLLAALIYFLIVVQFFIADEYFPLDHIVYDLSVGLALGGWIAAWVHAFMARIEYLQFMARRVAPDKMVRHSHPEGKPIETRATLTGPPRPKRPLKMEQTKRKSAQTPPIININKATERELTQLPSIGTFLAREIISVRKEVFAFASYTHLVNALNIKPHVLAKAKPYIVYSDDERKENQRKRKNEQIRPRKTEPKPPSEKRTGRVVDY